TRAAGRARRRSPGGRPARSGRRRVSRAAGDPASACARARPPGAHARRAASVRTLPRARVYCDEPKSPRERMTGVTRELAHLSDRQREAIELAYYGGFTQSELAERLGQPLGTIKSRMFMGLAQLRVLLGEPGLETSWMPTT